MAVRRIAVLGAGDMGHGIAQLAAMAGFDVRLRDVDQKAVDRAMERVRWSLDKLAEKKTITRADADASLARITATTDAKKALGDADLVIEAVPEDLALKQRVFAEVERIAPAGAILATNTSTMLIADVGAKLQDATRLVGMHFFNPVLLMDLVEVIPGPRSANPAIDAVVDVAKGLGKTTVVLKKDSPGFVTSRLIGVWMGASMMANDHGVAPPHVIDSAMRHKEGFPMGPFEVADYTGLDVCHHAAQYVGEKLGPAYAPSRSLTERATKGDLGKKTGRGFYTWKDGRRVEEIAPDAGKLFEPKFIMSLVANDAARLLKDGVASAEDIDLAMRNGCAFPKGPLEWADERGLDVVHEALTTIHSSTKSPLAAPSPLLGTLVKEGHLGRKSGRGFRTYDTGAARAYETLVVHVDDASHVATVTINRPHRMNAMNDQLIRELDRAFAELEADARVRAIVLTGSGDKAFCAGADLTDVADARPALMVDVARRGHMMCLRMEKMPKPIVAAINGYAFGGGLELALACDFRLAARRAKMGLTEVTLGLVPAMGGTQRLPKLVGLARAKEIAMLGEKIDAERAHDMGLVHRVIDNDAFAREVSEFGRLVASRAPIALGLTKQLLNAAPTTDLASGMEAEANAFGVAASTDDVVEGLGAFFEKRKPDFKGR